MNRFSFIKKMFCLVLTIAMMLSMITTTFAAENYEQYEIKAIIDGKENTIGLTVLNFHGSAYISVDMAAELSGMEYSITANGDYLFSKDLHHVTYDGQVQVVNGITYVRMQDAMDRLSCQYAYFPSLEALVFDPTEDFIENLQLDCDTAFSRFDLGWVKDVPLAEETIRLYGFFSGGWNPKYFWSGDKIEQYENTLWGIMVPDENESTLLNIANSGNKAAEAVSNIVKLGKEGLSVDLSEAALLAPADFMDTYKYLNDAIPGMDISSYIDLLEKAYGSQYASTLYINAIQYGLFNNTSINDTYLNAALQKAGKYFDDDTLLLQSFLEDWAINYVEDGIKELSKSALEETFSYSSFSVKIAKLFSDEIIGMKKDTGAVLALLNCAEIQEEAQKQYEKSLLRKESANAALTMKYSTILYLRACEYGYEKYKSTGEDGEYCYEIIQPLTSALIKLIAAYSDEELTREVKNENLKFSLPGFMKKEYTDTDSNESLSENMSVIKEDDVQQSENSPEKNQIYAVDFLGKNYSFLSNYFGESSLHYREQPGGSSWAFAYGTFTEDDYSYGIPTNLYWVFEIYSSSKVYVLDDEDVITAIYPGAEPLFPLAEGIYPDMSDEELLKAANVYGYEYTEELCDDYYLGKEWAAQKEIYIIGPNWIINYSRYTTKTYVEAGRK